MEAMTSSGVLSSVRMITRVRGLTRRIFLRNSTSSVPDDCGLVTMRFTLRVRAAAMASSRLVTSSSAHPSVPNTLESADLTSGSSPTSRASPVAGATVEPLESLTFVSGIA